jgi:hypothetical protein
VQAACDAAHAEVARQKWLELELARQNQRADAALQQVVAMEKEQQELRARMDRMQVCVCV